MNEFYVGYLPNAPAGIARRIKTLIAVVLVLGAVAAITFARVQKTFSNSTFEYGKERNFEGVLENSPYPALVMAASGAADSKPTRFLLVAAGKHGADNQVQPYTGRTVRLRGTLIYRDNQSMIELVKDSVVVTVDTREVPAPMANLGTFTLIGEIVDSKCHLGVMNPGNGKVHRDCAVRCLSGGIPPIFATNDFRGVPAILLLTGADGRALNREVLSFVGEPVEISGEVVRSGSNLILKADPSRF